MHKSDKIQALVSQGKKTAEERVETLLAIETGMIRAEDGADGAVDAAIRSALSQHEGEEKEDYADYIMQGIDVASDALGATIVVNPDPLKDAAIKGDTHIVSQSFVGDFSLVAGIYATDDVLIPMAARYAGERVDTIDDLALDALLELINVIHGNYAVVLGKRGRDVDLYIPRYGKDVVPHAAHQAEVCMLAPFGAFRLVLASDEFVPMLG